MEGFAWSVAHTNYKKATHSAITACGTVKREIRPRVALSVALTGFKAGLLGHEFLFSHFIAPRGDLFCRIQDLRSELADLCDTERPPTYKT